MTKVNVYAPNAGYTGSIGAIRFQSGVAEVDSEDPTMSYFRRKGYGIGTPPAAEASLPADRLEPMLDGKPVDARDHAESRPFGSLLRDAAVDPQPGDYLPPTNAGQANPHGPAVVAPGIEPKPAPVPEAEEKADDAPATAAVEDAQPDAPVAPAKATGTKPSKRSSKRKSGGR